MAVIYAVTAFDYGLYLVGGREAAPNGATRVATGTNPIHGHSIQSRNGNVLIYMNQHIINCISFANVIYSLNTDGVFLEGTNPIKTGLVPMRRATFAKAPPALGGESDLFVCGAGTNFKVSEGGVVTNWGIVPPTNGGAATTVNVVGFTSGLLGNYSYYYSYKNSLTGSYSEPEPIPISISSVTQSNAIKLTNLPTFSNDPQVDTLVLWRTIGNRGLYYEDVDIPLATFAGTYYDITSDFAGFGTQLSAFADWLANASFSQYVAILPKLNNPGGYVYICTNGGLGGATEPVWNQAIGSITTDNVALWQNVGNTLLLGTNQLVLGLNTVAPSTVTACAFFGGTMFLCGDTAAGARGRIYFSCAAVGAEGVAGYVDISNDDDPTVGFGVYAAQLYCFTEKGIWLVQNLTQSPYVPAFTAIQIGQAPGAKSTQSIQSTPQGIIYQSSENDLYLWNGFLPANVSGEARAIFAGQTVEGYAPIGTILAATYGRNEYWFSDDGQGTWAINIMADSLPSDTQHCARPVRCHGTGSSALYYQPENGRILAGWSSGVYQLEQSIGSPDASLETLPFALRPPSFYSGDKYTGKAARVLLDANPGGNVLTVYLSVDGTDYLLGTATGTTRAKFEFPANITGSVIGFYVTSPGGSGTIEIFRIALDGDVSGQDDAGTAGGVSGGMLRQFAGAPSQ